MAVTDAQLAHVLVRTVRLVNRAQDEVLSEVEMTPVLDSEELDAALDSHRILDTVLESDAVPSTVGHEKVGEAKPPGGFRGRLHAPSALGLGREALSSRFERMAEPAQAMRDRTQPRVSKVLGSVRGEFYPGHPSWSTAPVQGRVEWWADRLGILMAATIAVPGLTGRGAKLTRIVPLLGSAAQMVAICAVAHEAAVHEEARIVQVIAKVVFNRSVTESTIREAIAAPLPRPQLQDLDGEELLKLRRLGSAGAAVRQIKVIRTVTGYVRELDSLLDERPQGGWVVRKLTNLPVAGAAATFYSERAGIRHATSRSLKAFQE